MQAQNISRRLTMWAGVMAVILLIPLLGNWPWTLGDFIAMGILISAAGLSYELIASALNKPQQRVIAGLLVAAAFFVIWAELSVGIFGSPFAGS